MLWNPAFHGALGTKPVVSSDLPALASPVQGFDTSNTALFFTDTAGTAPAANGSLIARANDAFGGAYFFRQQVSGERPTLVTNAANGKPVLRFDGNTKWMALQNAASGFVNAGELFRSLTFTLMIAYRRSTAGGSGLGSGVFAAGNSTGGEGGNAYDNLTVQTTDPGPPAAARHSGSQYSNLYLNSPGYGANQVTKLILRGAPANGMTMVAKSATGTYTGSAALPTTPDSWTWDFAALGAEMGHKWGSMPYAPFTGDIMELRFWNSRATDNEVSQLLTYLDAKWGN